MISHLLKIQDKKKEEKKEETSIEELIEQKRSELSAQNKSLTPVNLQTFVAWKKRKLREKADQEKKDRESKKKKMKDGLTVGMSGRDMFLFDPKMVSNEVSLLFLQLRCLDQPAFCCYFSNLVEFYLHVLELSC